MRFTLTALLALSVAIGPAGAASRSDQHVNSQFDPEVTERHPTRHKLAMVLTESHPNGARVFATYSHQRSRKPNRGKIDLVVRVLRPGGRSLRGDPVVELAFPKLRVRDGRVLVDVLFETPLEAGDWMEFDYTFRGRPAIRAEGGEAAFVQGTARPL